ncbi:hypothetical protein JQS43_10155 [Natronosporangium hydrolyticum]|uniref:Uncharacterized protein n=1 Tax=Natronosporangium hydrolyticum TaxID=2811111 RepID=A0A895YRF5_9ACTN|nr:hypothetical protein [Natronosporangium hydrolyticum]QSB16598.1 hypothetical protein JQS43_10155 [Natronosporangium hydrolyticum]
MSGWEDDDEVLPDTTQDERGPGWGDDYPGPGSHDSHDSLTGDDRRLLAERPPHWG